MFSVNEGCANIRHSWRILNMRSPVQSSGLHNTYSNQESEQEDPKNQESRRENQEQQDPLLYLTILSTTV